MGDLDLTGLGAAGIFIVLVLRQVFEFVNTRKQIDGGEGTEKKLLRDLAHLMRKHTEILSAMLVKITDLHDWHAPDPAGRQTWKSDVREILEETHAAALRIERKLSG